MPRFRNQTEFFVLLIRRTLSSRNVTCWQCEMGCPWAPNLVFFVLFSKVEQVHNKSINQSIQRIWLDSKSHDEGSRDPPGSFSGYLRAPEMSKTFTHWPNIVIKDFMMLARGCSRLQFMNYLLVMETSTRTTFKQTSFSIGNCRGRPLHYVSLDNRIYTY